MKNLSDLQLTKLVSFYTIGIIHREVLEMFVNNVNLTLQKNVNKTYNAKVIPQFKASPEAVEKAVVKVEEIVDTRSWWQKIIDAIRYCGNDYETAQERWDNHHNCYD